MNSLIDSRRDGGENHIETGLCAETRGHLDHGVWMEERETFDKLFSQATKSQFASTYNVHSLVTEQPVSPIYKQCLFFNIIISNTKNLF